LTKTAEATGQMMDQPSQHGSPGHLPHPPFLRVLCSGRMDAVSLAEACNTVLATPVSSQLLFKLTSAS
ncbi:Hypothetical predicted protein, partial [Marmota monax]